MSPVISIDSLRLQKHVSLSLPKLPTESYPSVEKGDQSEIGKWTQKDPDGEVPHTPSVRGDSRSPLECILPL